MSTPRSTLEDRRRHAELKFWLAEHDIQTRDIAQQLGCSVSTAYYNLRYSCEPQKRQKLLELGLPAEFLPPERSPREPRFPGLARQEAAPDLETSAE